MVMTILHISKILQEIILNSVDVAYLDVMLV